MNTEKTKNEFEKRISKLNIKYEINFKKDFSNSFQESFFYFHLNKAKASHSAEKINKEGCLNPHIGNVIGFFEKTLEGVFFEKGVLNFDELKLRAEILSGDKKGGISNIEIYFKSMLCFIFLEEEVDKNLKKIRIFDGGKIAPFINFIEEEIFFIIRSKSKKEYKKNLERRDFLENKIESLSEELNSLIISKEIILEKNNSFKDGLRIVEDNVFKLDIYDENFIISCHFLEDSLSDLMNNFRA